MKTKDYVKKMTLDDIRNNYGTELSVTHTGGNCTANFHELNTNQDHLYIADDCNALTNDFEQNISVVVHNKDGDELESAELSNLFELNEYLGRIFYVWGY